MPLDPFLADRVAPLTGISLSETMRNPALQDAWWAALTDDRPYDAPDVARRDVEIGGDHPCTVRVYTPDGVSDPARPALVWAHGGGYVAGTLDDHEADTVAREVCARAGAVIVSVDYPLANGSTVGYPTLHRTFAGAFCWTLDHAADLGIDPARVALGGASAGANLTLAAAMELRDADGPLPASLVLVYPSVSRQHHTNDEHEARMREVPMLVRLQQDMIDSIYADYLGDYTDEPTYMTFEHFHDLGELPPILLVVSEYDDFRVSAELLFSRPENAHLQVSTYLAEGVIHGHLAMTPLLAETDATLDRISEHLTA